MHLFQIGDKVAWANVATRSYAPWNEKNGPKPDTMTIEDIHHVPMAWRNIENHSQWIILLEDKEKRQWLGSWFAPIAQSSFILSCD